MYIFRGHISKRKPVLRDRHTMFQFQFPFLAIQIVSKKRFLKRKHNIPARHDRLITGLKMALNTKVIVWENQKLLIPYR
jgi:hypothetical protein